MIRKRLGGLHRRGSLATSLGPGLERVARLASRLLDAPVVLVTLGDDHQDWLTIAAGRGEAPRAVRSPAEISCCRLAARSTTALVMESSVEHAVVRGLSGGTGPAPIACLGVGLTSGGPVLGALCVFDAAPRAWTEEDVRMLRDLAACAWTEIELGSPAGAEEGVSVATRPDGADPERASQALEQSEATFRSLIESASEIITIVDRSGAIRYGNPAVERVLGYVPGELLARQFQEITHAEDLESAAEMFRRVLRTPGEPIPWRLRLRHRNGSHRHLEGVSTNLLHDPGVQGIVANCGDVSDRIVVEAALAESRRLLTTLLNGIPGMAYRCRDDAGRTMQFVSEGCLDLTGYSPDELVGSRVAHYAELIHPEDAGRVVREVRAALDDGRSFQTEYRIRTADGAEKWVWEQGAGILSQGGELLFVEGLTIDVTDRKLAALQLASYSLELERSNRELQEFASIASHDLQEPLRKVQAFGDRLKARFAGVLDDAGRDYLDRMQNAAGRMQLLIQELLAYSRITSRAQPFERVALGRIAEEAVQDLADRLEQSRGRVVIETLPEIEADPLQMRQLFQNLIGNGLKFHREDVAPRVVVSGTTARGIAELRVSDNGIGFEAEYAERVFSPFERLHARLDYEGTGMGLAIVRKVVERHGGTVRAESSPGEGATFIVQLPIHHFA